MEIANDRKPASGTQAPKGVARSDSTAIRVKEERRAKGRKIADQVRRYMEDQKISRPQLEKEVGRSESTMNHFFAGDFSASLLARVERALGRQFGESSSVAPVEWGAYTQESTAWLAGSYLTLRTDYRNFSRICAYVTAIEWGKIEQAHIFDGKLIQQPKIDGYGLIFREERRVERKYTHRGQVWFPSGPFLYLVTAYGEGRLRAAIASLPDYDGKMIGIQLTQYNPMGSAYVPAAAPIAFIRRKKITDDELGYIQAGHPLFENYKGILSEASNDVVFALPGHGGGARGRGL